MPAVHKRINALSALMTFAFGWIPLQSSDRFSYDASGNPVAVQTISGNAAPQILRPPLSALAQPGGSVSFGVVATGEPAPSYQWQRNESDMPGETRDVLRLTGLQPGDFATYRVVVTNSAGSLVSDPASLTPDTDGDGLPDVANDSDGDRMADDWEMTHFTNLNATARADADNDGVTNIDEFTDGTNPRLTASRYFRLTLGQGVSVAPAQERYAPGTTVTLTATDAAGLSFLEWTGGVTGYVSPATLTMDADKSVTAIRGTHAIDRTWLANVTGNDGGAHRLLPLASGKIMVAGRFSACNGRPAQSLVRLNADLTVDPAFAPRPGPQDNRDVWSILEQPDGKLIIAGEFDTVNGIPRRGLARLWPDGRLDTSFNAANVLNSWAYTAVRLSDGRIAVGGTFTQVGGVARVRVAVLTADGVLDPAFDPGTGFNDTVNSMALDAGDALLCGGRFALYNGTTVGRVVRLSPSGALDPTFNAGGTGANNIVDMVKKLPDGRIGVSGAFTNFNGTAIGRIVLLNADGSPDAGFNPAANLNSSVYNFLLQANGKLLIGGAFNLFGTTSRSGIARLNADGTLDMTFDPGTGANNWIFSLLPLPGGRILTGGQFSIFAGQPHDRLVVLDGSNGALDTNAATHAALRGQVWQLAVQKDGRLLAAGEFTAANGQPRVRLARFLTSGDLDTSFTPDSANNIIHALHVQDDGKILIGGVFSAAGTSPHQRLTRLLPHGAVDPAWQPGAGFYSGDIHGVAVDPRGRIYAGGTINGHGDREQPGIVRLMPDGSIDSSFHGTVAAANDFYGGYVDNIALQPDGKVIICGGFAWASGASTSNIARLREDGSADPAFDAQGGSNGRIRIVKLLPDGKIIVAGEFTQVGGLLRSYLARLLPNGQPDPSFGSTGSGPNGVLYSVRILPDSRLLICGEFSTVNGIACRRMGLLEPDGSLVMGFNPGTGPDDNIYSVVTDTAGNVYAGGWVREMTGNARAGLLRLTTSPGLDVRMTALTPASPVLPGQALTFSATAVSTAGSITGLRFEASGNGTDFVPVADGVLQNGQWSGTWTPPGPGTWYVRAIASDLTARMQTSAALPVTVDAGGWNAWRAQYFTAAELADPAVSGPAADPDRDAQPNLAEYASDTHPRQGSSTSAPVPSRITIGAATHAAITFRVADAVTDAHWTVEISSGLSVWNAGAAFTVQVSSTANPDGTHTVTVRDTQPVIAGGKKFLRVRWSL